MFSCGAPVHSRCFLLTQNRSVVCGQTTQFTGGVCSVTALGKQAHFLLGRAIESRRVLQQDRHVQGSKRASKRRRSSEAADTAVVEAAAPAPKKPATGKASAEPSHSSEDVTTVVASTSRGHKLETLAEAEVEVPGSDDALDAEDVPDDADELILEAADNSSGSGEDDDEEEDEDEEMLDDELGDVDDDDVSYDSQIEGDVQTNVDGAEGPAADRETLVRLKGVKFFDDDEVTNAARSNMNRLLRNRRYHDDDVSESIVRHAVGPRYAVSTSSTSPTSSTSLLSFCCEILSNCAAQWCLVDAASKTVD